MCLFFFLWQCQNILGTFSASADISANLNKSEQNQCQYSGCNTVIYFCKMLPSGLTV